MSDHAIMTCAEVRDRLPLVPGADLLPAEDPVVRAHLAGCASCRLELGAFVRIRRKLRGLGSRESLGDYAEFFAELRADTLAAVRKGTAPVGSAAPTRSVLHPSISGVMTAAALFLIGVYLVSHWLPEPSGIRDLPPIFAPGPDESVRDDGRFRNVGYGLSGHRPLLSLQDPLFGFQLVPPSELPPPEDGRDDEPRDTTRPR